MKVYISGLDFSQEAGPLIKEFYPKTEVIITVYGKDTDHPLEKGLEEDSDEEISVSLTLILHEDGFKIYYGIEERCSKDFIYEDIPDENMTYEKRRRRAYRNVLFRELYRILSKETGKEPAWGILTGVRPTKLCFERLKKGLTDNVSYMTKEYLCSKRKAEIAEKIAVKEIELLKKTDYLNGYSLYVGIPFCPSICNYCSFGSHPIGRFSGLIEGYIDALIKEIESCSSLMGNRKLETVYFGGGTPTAVSVVQLRRVIEKVKSCFDMGNVVEFCVEAGRPDSIDQEKLMMLKEEGVTRISINPQSMRQRTLDIIGRKHTSEQIKEAFHMARSAGFDNINMDIIAGLSGEKFEDMEYTLDEIGKLSPDCLTVHTLALKRAARLNTDKEQYRGMEAEDVERMVDYAYDFCLKNGYEPYYLYRQKNMAENLENVGYARPGKEGLYNILIMEEVQMILALGAGASSKFFDLDKSSKKRFGRVENVKNVSEYIGRIDEMIERKQDWFKGRDLN